MFMAAQLIMGKSWKQPVGPSMVEWIKKAWCLSTMAYYCAITKDTLESFEGKGIHVEMIIEWRISQYPIWDHRNCWHSRKCAHSLWQSTDSLCLDSGSVNIVDLFSLLFSFVSLPSFNVSRVVWILLLTVIGKVMHLGRASWSSQF